MLLRDKSRLSWVPRTVKATEEVRATGVRSRDEARAARRPALVGVRTDRSARVDAAAGRLRAAPGGRRAGAAQGPCGRDAGRRARPGAGLARAAPADRGSGLPAKPAGRELVLARGRDQLQVRAEALVRPDPEVLLHPGRGRGPEGEVRPSQPRGADRGRGGPLALRPRLRGRPHVRGRPRALLRLPALPPAALRVAGRV